MRQHDTITIRTAGSTDATAVARLAELDSARIPAGELLVAESCGELVAAVAVQSGEAIADPFLPTAGAVEMLSLQAARRRRGPAARNGRRHIASLRRRDHVTA